MCDGELSIYECEPARWRNSTSFGFASMSSTSAVFDDTRVTEGPAKQVFADAGGGPAAGFVVTDSCIRAPDSTDSAPALP